MAINTGIPSANSLQVPGFYFNISPANAGNESNIRRVLIVGQAINSAVLSGHPVIASDTATVSATYGYGSMIANMYRKFRSCDAVSETWLLPVADLSGATAATSVVTISANNVQSGVLTLYVNGVAVSTPVSTGSSASTIATNVATLVDANVFLGVTASASGSAVTLTAKNAGAVAGDISVIPNLAGAVAGEAFPIGVTVSTVHSAGTGGDPDVASALANLGDTAYDAFVIPYGTVNAINAVDAVLTDASATGRWSATVQLFGFAFSAIKGNLSSVEAVGAALNSRYASILALNSPEPVADIAAAYAGTCTASLATDVALPLQNVSMPLVAPAPTDRFMFQDRNTLLQNGVATAKVDDYGNVILERAKTTYKTNILGLPDSSYGDTEVLFTLSYVIRVIRNALATKFSRVKLVADGSRIPYGSNFVTSADVKVEAIAQYKNLAVDGLVSDPSTFASAAAAENAGNGRVNLYLPIVLANQLRQIAVRFSFSRA